ncbi:protein of unknown function [Pararobbsia alpina]
MSLDVGSLQRCVVASLICQEPGSTAGFGSYALRALQSVLGRNSILRTSICTDETRASGVESVPDDDAHLIEGDHGSLSGWSLVTGMRSVVSAVWTWFAGESEPGTNPCASSDASTLDVTGSCDGWTLAREIRTTFEAWIDDSEDVEAAEVPSKSPTVAPRQAAPQSAARPVNASPGQKAAHPVQGWAKLCDPANAECETPRFNVAQCLLNIDQALTFPDVPAKEIRDVLLSGRVVKDVNIPPAFLNHGLPSRLNVTRQYVNALRTACEKQCVDPADVFNVVFGFAGRALRMDESHAPPYSAHEDIGTDAIVGRLLSDKVRIREPADVDAAAALAVDFASLLDTATRLSGRQWNDLRAAGAGATPTRHLFGVRGFFERLGCTQANPGKGVWMHEVMSNALDALGLNVGSESDPTEPGSLRWKITPTPYVMKSREDAVASVRDAIHRTLAARQIAWEPRVSGEPRAPKPRGLMAHIRFAFSRIAAFCKNLFVRVHHPHAH